jgi:hypothetical protein
MNTTAERIKSIYAELDTLKATKAVSVKKLAELDADLSSCYHIMEFVKLSGPQMSLVSKRMKEVLIDRRGHKETISMIDSIVTRMASGSVDTVEKSEHRVAGYMEQSHASYQRLFCSQGAVA